MLAKTKAWGMPLLICFAWSNGAYAVQADPIAQLVHQQRYGEASRAIDARLARNAADPSALAATVDLHIARAEPGDLAQARSVAERCVEANAESSLCAEAFGNALAAQTRQGGLLTLLRNAHATRDTLERAIRFNPTNYRARMTLMRFYLATPFFLGGSETRARELATEARRTEPELTRMMRALCALDDGNLDEAEQQIVGADLTGYELVRENQRELLLTLASAHLDAGRYDRSGRLFAELSRRVPSSEHGPYGLALVARAQGRLAEATLHLEQALALGPRPYVYKTLGEVYEARQDQRRAIAAYQSALSGIPPLALRDQKRVTAHLAQLQRR